MPTNRTKRTRDRVGSYGLTEAALSFFWWEGTIKNVWSQGRTEDDIQTFWTEHRRAILDWYIEKNRKLKGEPGRRPSFFWDEIKRKRRKTGNESYFKPCTANGPDLTEYFDPVYETDYQFLKRLGLLEGWELTYTKPVKAKKGGTTDERK